VALPNNILQQVQTYQMSGLAFLLNSFCGIHETNKKFKDFENLTANLGDTVTFDLPPRYNAAASLVVTFQDSAQRVQPLEASQSANVSYAFSNQQFIFNVHDYMERFGKSAIIRLGNLIETDILKNIISGVQNQVTGLPNINSGPFRFFGDGVTPINSFGQLAQALANFRDFGAAPQNTKCFLPMTNVPSIVNSGLNQFVMDRNEDLAMSWQLGRFSNCEFYQSNLLPIQVAGTVGNAHQTLTLTNVNDPTGNNVTVLTFSGATPNDPNAVKSGDLFQFQDGVGSLPNLRFLTFTGYNPSAQPVQFLATANVGADGSGNVVVPIRTVNGFGLVWAATANQNLNTALVNGMQVKALPTHRAGFIWSGDAFYLAMPALPEEVPFPTANGVDPDSGASIRNYYGSLFGQNQRGYVNDAIWGSTIVPEYGMRLAFPV